MKKRFKLVLMVLLVLALMFAGAVEAQRDCPYDEDMVDASVYLMVMVPMQGSEHILVNTLAPFRGNFGLLEVQYHAVYEFVDFFRLFVSDEDVLALREPFRPVEGTFSWGLEAVWKNDIRPELCSLHRELVRYAEISDTRTLGND